MKKTIKCLSIVLIVLTLVGVLAINVSAAASTTISGGEYTVGQSVNIPVRIKSDTPIMTAQIKINYNSSVLTLKSVSGAEYTSGNGSINIVDDNFSTATKDVTTGSYTLNFTAVAAGNSNISVSVSIADKNLAKSTATASANVKVVTPKPSSNSNLASIKLSNGSLSPAFNPNTTEYTATVRHDVSSITITGAVADGKSTYVGGGTFDLAVGDNERVLTVTAQDGTKKSYTITIKRMSEQETLDADQAARDANPTLVVIEGQDYTIVNDLTNVKFPIGFKQGTATRKEAELTVLNDEHGEYTLYWLVDANGENGAFYTRNEADQFTRLNYVMLNGKLYIIETPDLEGYLPQKYTRSTRLIDGVDVMVYNYVDSAFDEFCIVKCYINGTRGYYQFDTVEGTMQRAAQFDMDVKLENSDVDQDEQKEEKVSWFAAMSKTGKTVFIISIAVAVLFIVVAILLIVKISSSRYADLDDEFLSDVNDNFIISDFEVDEQEFGDEATESPEE